MGRLAVRTAGFLRALRQRGWYGYYLTAFISVWLVASIAIARQLERRPSDWFHEPVLIAIGLVVAVIVGSVLFVVHLGVALIHKRVVAIRRLFALRRLAAGSLSDQGTLADIAKHDGKPEVRRAAVERVTDQSFLVDIARHGGGPEVRRAAVERVTDQSLLADIAKDYREAELVRRAAVERVTDQSLLADIAKHGFFEPAVERMTDQHLLADVAMNPGRREVCSAALIRVTDQSMLTEIARRAPDGSIRSRAAERIIDQMTLADLVRNGTDHLVQSTACSKLTDSGLLAAIMRDHSDGSVRRDAVSQFLRHWSPNSGAYLADPRAVREILAWSELRIDELLERSPDTFGNLARHLPEAARAEALRHASGSTLLKLADRWVPWLQPKDVDDLIDRIASSLVNCEILGMDDEGTSIFQAVFNRTDAEYNFRSLPTKHTMHILGRLVQVQDRHKLDSLWSFLSRNASFLDSQSKLELASRLRHSAQRLGDKCSTPWGWWSDTCVLRPSEAIAAGRSGEKLLADWQQAVAMTPSHKGARESLAEICLKLGRFAEALGHYELLISQYRPDEDRALAHVQWGKGICLRELGQPRESLVWLDKAACILLGDADLARDRAATVRAIQVLIDHPFLMR
jgi:tetratricopeptide (TPR) repeat protein